MTIHRFTATPASTLKPWCRRKHFQLEHLAVARARALQQQTANRFEVLACEACAGWYVTRRRRGKRAREQRVA